jgi:hypothetical protein
MDKKKQLMEYITQDIIAYLAEDLNIYYTKAMQLFYRSDTFKKLMDEETGLYREGSAFVYDFMLDELKYGKISAEKY